jgi:hypothetical protein
MARGSQIALLLLCSFAAFAAAAPTPLGIGSPCKVSPGVTPCLTGLTCEYPALAARHVPPAVHRSTMRACGRWASDNPHDNPSVGVICRSVHQVPHGSRGAGAAQEASKSRRVCITLVGSGAAMRACTNKVQQLLCPDDPRCRLALKCQRLLVKMTAAPTLLIDLNMTTPLLSFLALCCRRLLQPRLRRLLH